MESREKISSNLGESYKGWARGKDFLPLLLIIIIIMTYLDNTITGRTSSSHCGPLKLQIQIAKIRSKNTVKN